MVKILNHFNIEIHSNQCPKSENQPLQYQIIFSNLSEELSSRKLDILTIEEGGKTHKYILAELKNNTQEFVECS